MGKFELRVPQDRQGRFRTDVFERYQRSEKALVGALTEMYGTHPLYRQRSARGVVGRKGSSWASGDGQRKAEVGGNPTVNCGYCNCATGDSEP